MKVLAFAASSSKHSINKQLAVYAASLLTNVEVEVLDLNDYELPIFSEDREVEIGQPEQAKQFLSKIGEADALVISFAEHNGNYSVAYKNIFDWCTRVAGRNVFQAKPMVILATSPGARGARRVLEIAMHSIPSFEGVIKASYSLPSFSDNFDKENARVSHQEMQSQLAVEMSKLQVYLDGLS